MEQDFETGEPLEIMDYSNGPRLSRESRFTTDREPECSCGSCPDHDLPVKE